MGQKDTTLRSLLFAGGVAFVCSLVVSSVVVLTKPILELRPSIERTRAIVQAAGTLAADASDYSVANAFLELDARAFDLSQGLPLDTGEPHAVPPWPLPGGPDQAVIFIASSLDGAPRVVVPMQAQGMWSTIYCLLALADDLVTIEALVVYRHAETPGVGDRIENPQWLDSWRGKRVFDEAGEVRFDVRKRGGADVHSVDAISGATLSSAALGVMVQEHLRKERFGQILSAIRSEGLNPRR